MNACQLCGTCALHQRLDSLQVGDEFAMPDPEDIDKFYGFGKVLWVSPVASSVQVQLDDAGTIQDRGKAVFFAPETPILRMDTATCPWCGWRGQPEAADTDGNSRCPGCGGVAQHDEWQVGC